MCDLIDSINKITGLNVKELLVKSDNLVTGTENVYLPVKAQKAWFRLKYPDGRISLEMTKMDSRSCTARCRIYTDKRDPEGSFVSENYATRFNTPGNTANYADWACTMAIGRALEDAGFGLQSDWKSEAVTETQTIPSPAKSGDENPSAAKSGDEIPFEDPNVDPPSPEPFPEPVTYLIPCDMPKTPRQALAVVCPIGTHRGKTFAELIALKEDVVGLADWILKDRKRTDSRITPQLKAVAEIIKRVAANPDIDLDEEL